MDKRAIGSGRPRVSMANWSLSEPAFKRRSLMANSGSHKYLFVAVAFALTLMNVDLFSARAQTQPPPHSSVWTWEMGNRTCGEIGNTFEFRSQLE